MQEVERSAPSVEEALEAALAELGASEQEVDVLIVQEAKSGFLGMGSQEAIVRVRLRGSGAELSEDVLEEQGEVAADFLEGLLERMGIGATIEPDLRDGTMYVDVLGGSPDDEDMGLLIGRHGQTLDALQELTRIVVSNRTNERCRVIVDVEDYRKRRRRRLIDRAHEVAKRVARTGREEEFEAMPAYERKIIHDAVAEISGADSASRGEDPERHVVIHPADR